jgi:hypothetical protein
VASNTNVHLKDIGFKQSEMDWGVYLRRNNKGTVMLSIYVDNIILFASSPELMKCSKQQILAKFSGIDEGEVKWYLGMRVTRDRKRRTIALEQGTYIESIVNKFLESDQKKQATTLMTCTRPDIAYITGLLPDTS